MNLRRAWRGVMSVTVVGLVLVGAVGCGGGGGAKPLSRAEFTKRAEAECAVLGNASNELAKAQRPSSVGKTVAAFVRGSAEGLRKFVSGFEGIPPPTAIEKDASDLVSVLGKYADGLDSLADNVKSGQTFQEALQANGTIVDRLNSDAGRATNIVIKLELAGCVLTP
jgi:hypothetical protein